MSSWSEVHKGASNGSELGAVEALQAHFAGSRMLLQALTGYVPGEKNACPPVKVTLFYELGSLKLCVNSPVDDRLGFVTLKAQDGSLEDAIEAALSGGIDWRKRPKAAAGGWQGGRK